MTIALPPAASSAWTSRAGAVAASKTIRAPAAPRAATKGTSASGARDVGEAAEPRADRLRDLPRRRRTASAGRRAAHRRRRAAAAYAATSPPRILNSQATAWASLTSRPSAPFSASPTRFSLADARSPASRCGWMRDRRQRRAWTVGPDRIDRVRLDGDQFAAGGAAGLRQPFDRFRRVQPGIVAELAVRAEVRFDPGRRRPVDDVLDGEDRTVDLRRRLQRVAAVDEQGRLVAEHDRQAGRAGKSGQPQQPLRAGRHVFVLVLVGARDDEPGEPTRRELGAQRRGARRAMRRPADLGETLIAGDKFRRSRAQGRSASVTTWPIYGSWR